MNENILADDFACCGGNDERPPSHCADCPGTPPRPKATEPSDVELADIARVYPYSHVIEFAPGRRRLYNAGRASRDAEVEALKAERDKLHAAIAWYAWWHWPYANCHARCWVDNRSGATEAHDGTPAGRAAALVRLFERCTDGK